MKMRGYHFYVFLLFSFLLTNCKKEEMPKPPLEEILVASKWQLNRVFMENPPGGGAIELTNFTFKNCELDDLFEFKSDGSFLSDENGSPCAPINNSVFYKLGGGDWDHINDTLINLHNGFLNPSYHVREYNKEWLDLTQLSENYVGQPELYIYRFHAVK